MKKCNLTSEQIQPIIDSLMKTINENEEDLSFSESAIHLLHEINEKDCLTTAQRQSIIDFMMEIVRDKSNSETVNQERSLAKV